MQGIKNIVLDFGCVLVDLDKQRAVDAFNSIGAPEIAAYIDDCKQEDLFHELEIGDITLDEFCDKVREKCPRCHASNQEICDAWDALLLGIPDRRIEAIRCLAKRYRMFVLSNTNWLHWRWAEEKGIPELVERVFLSCDMHLIKPDVEIFRRMLDEGGLKAEETLFVDDSAANCRGAEAVGIRTMHVTDGDEWLSLVGRTATVGFFDGVHLGHQYLLGKVADDARQHGLLSTAITFDRHPREVLHSDYQPQLITTFDEKFRLLSESSVDCCEVLTFDEAMAGLSARDFMQQVLQEKLNVKRLFLGYDHRFGHDLTSTFDDYVRYGRQLGIEVIRGDAYQPAADPKVSSSAIRSLLLAGDVEKAANLLGRHYEMTGVVVRGEQEGRKIGFPTANLSVDSHKLVPAGGVYAVDVLVEGRWHRAMMNIGTRPTYTSPSSSSSSFTACCDSVATTTLEIHILDFAADLYGQQLTVRLLRRLRKEQRFDSPEALRQQLLLDREKVKK